MTIKVASPKQAFYDKRRALIRSVVEDQIKTHFPVFNEEKDIVNIVMAQIYHESRFNLNASGLTLNPGTEYGLTMDYIGMPLKKLDRSSGAADYWGSTPIKNVRLSGSAAQAANIKQGLMAIGVSQVMGWNFVRGASAKTGQCEIERIRPDLAQYLCVNAGDDIVSKIQGEANLPFAVMSGLVLLEGKWRMAKLSKGSWVVGKVGFSSHINAALGAYLGVNGADANGTTAVSYAANINGGDMYLQANGTTAPAYKDGNTQYAKNTIGGPAAPIGTKKAATGCA